MSSAFDQIQLAMPPGEEARAVAFFCGVIGLREEPKPGPLAERGGCWFASGCCKLHLGGETDFVAQSKAHPAFLSSEIDALAARLEAHGHPVCWATEFESRQRFYSEDPFGNRLEFIRDGDGFSQK